MYILIKVLIIFMLYVSISYAQGSPPLAIQDEGGVQSRPVNIIDCVGDGIECTFSVNKATLNVSAAGGSCFEVDGNDDLMPVSGSCTDTLWEEDGNSDLMPQA